MRDRNPNLKNGPYLHVVHDIAGHRGLGGGRGRPRDRNGRGRRWNDAKIARRVRKIEVWSRGEAHVRRRLAHQSVRSVGDDADQVRRPWTQLAHVGLVNI